ncbi:MAG: O-antigen ligase domain-containing protein [Chloroflexi bacterium]|nr:O-antigen ligase domain-containing protein [Chloroflexota bacterium]
MYRLLFSQHDLKKISSSQNRQFLLVLGGILLLTALVGQGMLGKNPGLEVIAWLIYGAGIVTIFIKPIYGLYLTVFFSISGDMVLIPWYPFNKNFSSVESIFFINSSLKFSALELYLVILVLAWAGRQFSQKKLTFSPGTIAAPMIIFMVSVVYGLVYGIFRHGNLTTALWECRAMFYLPLIYFLVVNLVENRQQVNGLMWAVILGNIVQAFVGCWYYLFFPGGSSHGSDGIMEHGASIHLNVLFIYVIALYLFKGPKVKRNVLVFFCLPALFAFLVNERRASFVSLGIAIVLLGVGLFRQNRRVFWNIAPPLTVIAVLFLGATWNNSGTLGLPARGIKSALGLDISARDSSSNVYRDIENINTNFTIHQVPLTGLGFGNKFYIIVPMPDISFFVWWEYITHNSIMWIWMQTGVFGFLSLLIMIGGSLAIGVRSYDRIPGGDMKAIGATLLLYIIMHFVFAYVDMSWDSQNMLLIGVSVGVLGSLDRVMSKPVRLYENRYRWLKPMQAEVVLAEEE